MTIKEWLHQIGIVGRIRQSPDNIGLDQFDNGMRLVNF
jgi:hypothetical protein